MIRITIVCPETMMADAAQLVAALGTGPDDAKSLTNARWHTQDGTRFAAASALVEPDWIDRATRTLVRPVWDGSPYAVNMAAAERARAALQIVTPVEGAPIELPGSTAIALVRDMAGLRVLDALGLRAIEDEEIA